MRWNIHFIMNWLIRMKNNIVKGLIIACMMMTLCACGVQSQSDVLGYDNKKNNSDKLERSFDEIAFEEEKLLYASEFQIEKSKSETLITIGDEGQILLLDENAGEIVNVPDGVKVLRKPIDNIYLVSSTGYDLVNAIGGNDQVSLTGTKKQDWYVESAIKAMEDGKLTYAGKYSAPDYELILSSNCNLAIENTMIYHNPEVKEKLEELGIQVLVERSSYEEHPLGRLEWVKFYGALLGRESEADSFLKKQLEKIEPVIQKEKTNISVAFFSINSNGNVVVRKPKDYISKMIELAGANYALDSLCIEEENALSTMQISFEEFYVLAKDADILVYNSTIEGEIESITDLLQKNEMLKDFKAVSEGQVYCTGKDFFQETTGTCDFIEDIYIICSEKDVDHLKYLKRIKE